ncbi:MAG: hypothetical protein GQF41_3226 [Candidatus Rifleibacterium amylolyticum]|nr:MAG: hypothetical protein GQF41_3226 [Candidatus Rifleibacterium amylolyticum]
MRKVLYPLLQSLFVLCLLYFSSANNYLMNYSYDILINLKNFAARSDDVVIIGIDSDSFNKYDISRSGVIPRSVYAELINRTADLRPAVLAFDVIFERRLSSDDDAALIGSLASYPGSIVMSSTFQASTGSDQQEIYIEPWKEIGNDLLSHGYVNIFRGIRDDTDSIRRRYLPFKRLGNDTIYSLPLAIMERLGKLELNSESNELSFYRRPENRLTTKLKLYEGYSFINYIGDINNFYVIPFSEFIEAGEAQRKIHEKLIENRIVLVGVIDPLYRDFQDIPALSFSLFPKRKQEYGVVILANVIENLLNNKVIRAPSPTLAFSGMLLGNAAFAAITAMISPLASFALLLTVLLSCLFLAFYLFFSSGLLINYFLLATSLLAIYLWSAFAKYRQARIEQQNLFAILQKYVSPEVAKLITRNEYEKTAQGEKKVITVVFSDIRGFTHMSEHMDPWEISKLLNEYFNKMTEIIFRNGGTIDKFIGDAIMILFGAPISQADAAFRAVKTACEMREELKNLRKSWQKARGQVFDIGIGIHSGEAFVGNLGSDNHKEYTALGDAVNTAARLESKALPGQILFSDAVWREIGHLVKFNELEPLVLKGKSRPQEVYELLEMLEEKPAD